jgi:hypothetical protein
MSDPAFDLGDNPQVAPPDSAQKAQLQAAIGVDDVVHFNTAQDPLDAGQIGQYLDNLGRDEDGFLSLPDTYLSLSEGYGLYWPSVGFGAYIDAGGNSISMGNVSEIFMNSPLYAYDGLFTDSIYGINTSYGISLAGQLLDGPTPSLDWQTRQLMDSTGSAMLSWDTGFSSEVRVDATNLIASYIIMDNAIQDQGFMDSIDPNDRQLIDPSGNPAAQWSNGYFETDIIYGIGGSIGIEVFNGYLVDGGIPTLDWINRQLIDPSGNPAAQWSNGYFETDSIYGIGGSIGIEVASGYLADAGIPTLDWMNRELLAYDGTSVSISWFDPTPVFAYGATLEPTAVSYLAGGEGTISYVNDADSPTVGSAVVGDGSDKCLVCYNGTDWIVTAIL